MRAASSLTGGASAIPSAANATHKHFRGRSAVESPGLHDTGAGKELKGYGLLPTMAANSRCECFPIGGRGRADQVRPAFPQVGGSLNPSVSQLVAANSGCEHSLQASIAIRTQRVSYLAEESRYECSHREFADMVVMLMDSQLGERSLGSSSWRPTMDMSTHFGSLPPVGWATLVARLATCIPRKVPKGALGTFHAREDRPGGLATRPILCPSTPHRGRRGPETEELGTAWGCPASEISRRVYTRRRIIDRWVPATGWMPKVAPHAYTQGVISDSGGAAESAGATVCPILRPLISPRARWVAFAVSQTASRPPGAMGRSLNQGGYAPLPQGRIAESLPTRSLTILGNIGKTVIIP